MAEMLPQRKRLRLPGYDYGEVGYYFATICTAVRHRNILCAITPAVGGGLCAAPCLVELTEIGKAVDSAIQDIPRLNPGVGVDIYCIMSDHIHLIVALGAGRDGVRPLPDIIGRLKSYTDRRYRELGAPFGPKLWQKSYYDHVIRTSDDLEETRRYIENNPLKRTEPNG